jgi:3-phosphoshikimate 1-carboxyvinyltransferase
VTLEVVGEVVSQPYVDLTLEVMGAFGVSVERDGYQRFRIHPQGYRPGTYAVEGDASSAGYWWALAAVTGSRIRVTNVPGDSHQGDVELARILERMGCQVSTEGGITVQGARVLRSPGSVDMNRVPDAVMTLAVVAALAEGETRILNVANLRIKESDRLTALVTELRRVGIDAAELPDGLSIRGGEPHGAPIETYADHRMAMSFAILGTRVPGISIRAPECVSKSYPNFFEELQGLYPIAVRAR